MRRYIFDVGISVLVWHLTGDVPEKFVDILNKNQSRQEACKIKIIKKAWSNTILFRAEYSYPVASWARR
jgi:hypothetical protein